MLAAGFVDVTVTYNKAAEVESIRSGAADDKVGRKYAFRVSLLPYFQPHTVPVKSSP